MIPFMPHLARTLRFGAVGSNSLFSLVSLSKQQVLMVVFFAPICFGNGKGGTFTWPRIPYFCFSSAVDISDFDGDELHDNSKETEKHAALHLALAQLAGDFGKESMLSLQRFFVARRKPVIPTGSLKLDLALGIGGLPKGRIVEIYGREASGKTTIALHAIKEAQKRGGYCAYLDVENAFDSSLAESIGINLEKLLVSQPDSAENLLSIVNTLTNSGSVDVIVIDSVAALIPQSEIDFKIGERFSNLQSQIMTKALRKIHYSLCHSDTLIIFVNQVRFHPKSAQGFGQAAEVTCGGNALPFYAAVRMRTLRKGLLKYENKVTGLGICVEVVKNKLAPAMKTAEVEIEFGKGIRLASEVIELACEHGVVVREGNSYFIDGEVVEGKEAAVKYLVQNKGACDLFAETLRSRLFENATVAT